MWHHLRANECKSARHFTASPLNTQNGRVQLIGMLGYQKSSQEINIAPHTLREAIYLSHSTPSLDSMSFRFGNSCRLSANNGMILEQYTQTRLHGVSLRLPLFQRASVTLGFEMLSFSIVNPHSSVTGRHKVVSHPCERYRCGI